MYKSKVYTVKYSPNGYKVIRKYTIINYIKIYNRTSVQKPKCNKIGPNLSKPNVQREINAGKSQ